jgi:hypothetical protein
MLKDIEPNMKKQSHHQPRMQSKAQGIVHKSPTNFANACK